MTFKDVAVKNFKFNARKYFSYFLCSSFCITVLFMYSTLLFNNEIVRAVRETPIYSMMKLCLLVIGVFCFFFISYTQSAFMKSRNGEFGLFLTLGMTKKDINKIIKVENSIIILLALIFGLIAGTVFSRLFFMIVAAILKLERVNYILSYKSYVISTGLFLSIFIINLLAIRRYTRKLEITELIHSRRTAEKNKIKHSAFGVIGMISIIVSFILMYFTLKGDIFKHQSWMVAVFMFIGFIGVYISISYFGHLRISLLRKNKRLYFKNIISLKEINHKFNQYKKILFVVCILSGAAVFFIGLTFSLYATTKEYIMLEYPYDIMYVETAEHNKLTEDEIKKVVDTLDNPLVENESLKFIQMGLYKKYDGEYKLWSEEFTVFSESEVNKMLDKPINVFRGNAVILNHNKEVNSWYKSGEIVKLEDNKSGKIYELNFQEEIYESILSYQDNLEYDTLKAAILDDEDFDKMFNTMNKENVSYFHLLNLKDWKNAEKAFQNLMNKLKESNDIPENDKLWETMGTWKAKGIEALRPVSKIEMYEKKIKEYGFFFFVMSFIGLLFFISSGVVLYFKTYADLEDAKIRYKKLFKIGITDSEMKKVISGELKPIFFLPIILGSILGIGYISIMFVNINVYEGILFYSMVFVLIYFILQSIFYLITRQKYFSEIFN